MPDVTGDVFSQWGVERDLGYECDVATPLPIYIYIYIYIYTHKRLYYIYITYHNICIHGQMDLLINKLIKK